MEQKIVHWLQTESALWVEEGLITPQQAEALRLRYPVGKAASPAMVLFAILGSLLVGAGVILVFATNWWRLPIPLRLGLAFSPLLAAQGLCLYVFRRKNDSAAFRESGALLLSLAFFAAMALIAQVFHTPGDLGPYLLVCALCTLPGAYFFRAKAALSVYVFAAMAASWSYSPWVSLLLTALALPFFYGELTRANPGRGLRYQLFLLSLLLSNSVFLLGWHYWNILETALLCTLALLVLDALFARLGSGYFFTPPKFLAIACFTVTLLLSTWDFSGGEHIPVPALLCAALLTLVYAALRRLAFHGWMSGDLFAAAALVLLLCAPFLGLASCVLAMGLGVFYIVWGGKALALRKINYGMTLVVAVILLRFFDSALGLLGRGVVFIVLGLLFLGINLSISRRRKERPL